MAVGEEHTSLVFHQVRKGRSWALPSCFLPTSEWPAHTWPFICLQDQKGSRGCRVGAGARGWETGFLCSREWWGLRSTPLGSESERSFVWRSWFPLHISVPGVLWAQANCGWGSGHWQFHALHLFNPMRVLQHLALSVAFHSLNNWENFTFPTLEWCEIHPAL